MTHKPHFVFFGTPVFAATVLQALLDADWYPELVITEPAKPVGRTQTVTPSPVERLARQAGIAVATPATAQEITTLLAPLELDLALVVAYGKLIPADALALPTHGMVNIHASLLPRHRGATPIQAAILEGDPETGLTYMLLEPTLDTGPVLSQHRLPILPDATTPDLFGALADLAGATVVTALTRYLDGQDRPTPQPATDAPLTRRLTKADGQVDLRTVDATELDRKFRAFFPWPGIYDTAFGVRLIVKRGHLDHGRFVIEELQWDGKRPVDAATFGRAYPEILTKLLENPTLATPKRS